MTTKISKKLPPTKWFDKKLADEWQHQLCSATQLQLSAGLYKFGINNNNELLIINLAVVSGWTNFKYQFLSRKRCVQRTPIFVNQFSMKHIISTLLILILIELCLPGFSQIYKGQTASNTCSLPSIS